MQVIGALWHRNVKLFLRNRVQLALVLIMPFFYLYLLSNIFKSAFVTNPVPYVLAGLVTIVVFQTSLNIAAATMEDIVSGYMKEVLVSPVKRMHIAIGQILSSTTVASFQGILILLAGYFVGMKYTSVVTPVAAIAFMIFTGLVFSAFGLFLAAIVKSTQTFQILTTAITTPMTFLCGVYVPLRLLPDGLQYLAMLNPMTYAAAFFRAVSLEKLSLSTDELLAEQLAFQIHDFVITPQMGVIAVLSFGILFFILSAFVFSNVDFSTMKRAKSHKDIFQQ
jgi:ABC-2 type transport system permease protein